MSHTGREKTNETPPTHRSNEPPSGVSEQGYETELGIIEEPAKEDALGDEEQAGGVRTAAFEADLVANLVSDLGPPFERDAAGGQARGDASWLEDDHELIGGNDRTSARVRP